MPRVSWFDIPADDPERAQKFYKEVFDWSFDKWDGSMDYWMTKTGTEQPGIDGGISKRMPGQTGNFHQLINSYTAARCASLSA